jgi:hypothetical protein
MSMRSILDRFFWVLPVASVVIAVGVTTHQLHRRDRLKSELAAARKESARLSARLDALLRTRRNPRTSVRPAQPAHDVGAHPVPRPKG